MVETDSPRLVLDVELVSAAPIEGTDKMMVKLRTRMGTPLEMRLTRAEAADFVALMTADREQARKFAARSRHSEPHDGIGVGTRGVVRNV